MLTLVKKSDPVIRLVRCGECPNCLEVERVKKVILNTLKKFTPSSQQAANENGALIWNTTLDECPCTNQFTL